MLPQIRTVDILMAVALNKILPMKYLPKGNKDSWKDRKVTEMFSASISIHLYLTRHSDTLIYSQENLYFILTNEKY